MGRSDEIDAALNSFGMGAMPRLSVGNLPAEVTSFVGRRHDLAEAKRLLSAARLLTLTGTGGVGKTRLAVRVAADIRKAFPDGVWLVELADLRDPQLLPSTAAIALGLRGAAAYAAGLAEYLEDKKLLLVLDNCEHMADECAALVAKLLAACSDVRVPWPLSACARCRSTSLSQPEQASHALDMAGRRDLRRRSRNFPRPSGAVSGEPCPRPASGVGGRQGDHRLGSTALSPVPAADSPGGLHLGTPVGAHRHLAPAVRCPVLGGPC
jgi:hypothetical protein